MVRRKPDNLLDCEHFTLAVIKFYGSNQNLFVNSNYRFITWKAWTDLVSMRQKSDVLVGERHNKPFADFSST